MAAAAAARFADVLDTARHAFQRNRMTRHACGFDTIGFSTRPPVEPTTCSAVTCEPQSIKEEFMARHILSSIAVLGLLLATAARADGVSDLRTTLTGLHGAQPLAATMQVSSTVKEGGDPSKTTSVKVQIEVSSDAHGLHMGFPPALLQRASQEAAANAKNQDAPTPIQNLLGRLSPVNVQPMVDYATALGHSLDGTTLASQKDEPHDGKPAHLLVSTAPVPAQASKQMTVKEYTGEVRVWIGADGVPMAVRETTKIKGRKFLISIDFGDTTDYSLRVISNRLVVVSRHTEESHSVFGNAGSSVTDATLVPITKPTS
jgi:hypothetical protein